MIEYSKVESTEQREKD